MKPAPIVALAPPVGYDHSTAPVRASATSRWLLGVQICPDATSRLPSGSRSVHSQSTGWSVGQL
jgi:hypothetical protein